MVSFLALVVFFRHNLATVFAAPTSPLDHEPPTSMSTGTRSLSRIIWGCLSTTFFFTWVVVHPNIGEEGMKMGWRRIRMTLWTMLVPELILAMAIKQWMAAREVRDLYNTHKGTLDLIPDDANTQYFSSIRCLSEKRRHCGDLQTNDLKGQKT